MEAAFKAGFVAIVGRPNAGKSTLINALLKQKLSIVSSKPQTTRHKILGIVDGDGWQLCLLDTPGLLTETHDDLQKALRTTAKRTAHDDADAVILLVEPAHPDEKTLLEFSSLLRSGPPVILALNKIDLPASPGKHDAIVKAFEDAIKPAAVVRISALKKTGVDELLSRLVALLPDSPEPLYEQGRLSDRWERFFAAELIREQVFELFGEEIPHATAVVIEDFREKPGKPDDISALLYVERDGQKGILVGNKGKALAELRDRSRQAIEEFLGRRADLQLWVKVRKNWRKDPAALKEFGYQP
ncbi:MAG: GTPase Era [Elusimicrobia bacterium]|nr:GTPase Era [Elusimicrobiota bacterium]